MIFQLTSFTHTVIYKFSNLIFNQLLQVSPRTKVTFYPFNSSFPSGLDVLVLVWISKVQSRTMFIYSSKPNIFPSNLISGLSQSQIYTLALLCKNLNITAKGLILLACPFFDIYKSRIYYFKYYISIINIMRPLVLKGHERPVTIVRFNYDGDLFFSGSAQTKINLWEAYTGERIGSYDTKASVRSLDVDMNSQYLIACGNDGSLQIFDVKSGKSIKYIRFEFKLKQVEFDLGSNRFLLLHDQYRPNTPSRIKVYNFKNVLNIDTSKDDKVYDKIQKLADFEIKIQGEIKPNKIATRALWYVDNSTFFVSTQDGWILHYNLKGDILKKALIHEATKINSLAFSKNFSVLATAADNGSKILDPETLQVIRYFKQELPMNAVSISPLFCDQYRPKFHMAMGGGVAAIMAAMTGGNSGFQAHICNIMHGNEVGKISGHYGPINSIEFFRDGRGFVSGGEQGIIRVIRFAEQYFQENNVQFE